MLIYLTQEQVYYDIGKPLLSNAFQGYNICLFSYGQTGSGKSCSIMVSDDYPGILPRFTEDLFNRIVELKNEENQDNETIVEISYFEIYNEN